MSTTIAVQPPPKPSYGAVELKEFIVKNTYRAFIYTMIGLLLIFLISILYSVLKGNDNAQFMMPPVSRLSILTSATSMDEQQQQQEDLAPPPPPVDVNVGPAARAGTPVAVPDAEIAADLKEFADMDLLDKATSEGGDGDVIPDEDLRIPGGDDIDVAKLEDVKTEDIPAPDVFIAVEVPPTTDLVALQKSIEYPEMARRAGIEGKVIVRVWIDKKGEPKKPEVLKSDSKLLNDAALKAVMKAVYSPAVQNKQPVGCWMTIPIKFTLTQ
jgi:periplasmic protein TonB